MPVETEPEVKALQQIEEAAQKAHRERLQVDVVQTQADRVEKVEVNASRKSSSTGSTTLKLLRHFAN